MADKDSLSEGELEDGELLSSDEEEEGQGDSKAQDISAVSGSSTESPVKSTDSPAKQNTADEKPSKETKSKAPDAEEGELEDSTGEIDSDDEEAAYYPHRVRRHSSPRERSPRSPRSSHSPSRERGDSRRRERSTSRGRRAGGGRAESSPERGRRRVRSRSRSPNWRRSPKRRVRSSDDERDRHSDDQDFSRRSSDRGERDFDYSGSGGRRPGRRDDSPYRGGMGKRRFGGYGQTHNYSQQRGSSGAKYSGNRGGMRGGRGSSFSGYHGNMGNQNFQGGGSVDGIGSEDVVARLQKGLSLLPPPKEPQCGNLDQFNYPAPPSWYLQEVEEWEKRMQEGAGPSSGTKGGGGDGKGGITSAVAISVSASQALPIQGLQTVQTATTGSIPSQTQNYLGNQIPIPSSQLPVPPSSQASILGHPPGQVPIQVPVLQSTSTSVLGYPSGIQIPIPSCQSGGVVPVSSVSPASSGMSIPQQFPVPAPAVAGQAVPIPLPGQVVLPLPPPSVLGSTANQGQGISSSPLQGAVSSALPLPLPLPPPLIASAQSSMGQINTQIPIPGSIPNQGQMTGMQTAVSVSIPSSTSVPMPSWSQTGAQISVPSSTLPTPGKANAQIPIPAVSIPSLSQVANPAVPAPYQIPVAVTTVGTTGQSIAPVSATLSATTSSSLPEACSDATILSAAGSGSGVLNPTCPQVAVVAAPSPSHLQGGVVITPPVIQAPDDHAPSDAGTKTAGTTLPSTGTQNMLQVPPFNHAVVAVEEGGGGAEDMEVCPISPTPNPLDPKQDKTSTTETPTSSLADSGGVVSEGSVTDQKPVIAKVNPQEQVIKLSEITRVQVYVAPVTANQLETASSPSDATPPSQQATPSLQQLTTPSPVPIAGTPPITSGLPNQPQASAIPVTTPIATPTLTDVLSSALPTTSTTPDEVKAMPVEDPPTEEATPIQDGVTYSLRSKAASNNASSAKKKSARTGVGVRPKLLSESDSEVNYDDYLDQLLDEEEEEPAGGAEEEGVALSLSSALSGEFPLAGGEELPSLDEQLSGDFPLINGSSESQEEETTLQGLVGLDPGHSSSKPTGPRRKSARRRQKESAWWTKKKEKEELEKLRAERAKVKTPCKYYLNGFCKNGENCDYSHEGTPMKKRDICKFYLVDSCMKGDDCIYYHGDFPCKFFHAKSFCKNGENCKFSHAPLTPFTRDLLLSVSELGVLSDNLVVSIPKDLVDPLIVSIPLSKLEERQRLKFFSIPKKRPAISEGVSTTASSNVPLASQVVGTSLESKPPPVQFSAPPPVQNLVPNFNQQPQQQAIQNQSQPIPLFPTHAPPSVGGQGAQSTHPQPPQSGGPPPPLAAPGLLGVPPPSVVPPIGDNPQRKVLLPTPPTNTKVLPEDFKKMKPVEYWEDPIVAAQLPPSPEPVSGPGSGPNPGPIPVPAHQPGMVSSSYGPEGTAATPNQYPQHQHPPPQRPPIPYHQPPSYHQQSPRPPYPSQHPRPPGFVMEQKPAPQLGVPRMEHRPPPGPARMDPRQNRGGGGPKDEMVAQQQWHQPPHQQNYAAPMPRPPHPSTYAANQSVGPLPQYPPPTHPPGGAPGFQVPPLSQSDQHHLQPGGGAMQQKASPIWRGVAGGGAGGRSPDQGSPSSQGGVSITTTTATTTTPTTMKRMDPRMKYSHLKIKPKGSSSPNQNPSKRPLPSDPSSISGSPASSKPFKIPKLLADTSALDKPIDPRELFKGTGGTPDTGYEEVSGPFGMFKSNFFSHSPTATSPPTQINSASQGDSKQRFGEITMTDGIRKSASPVREGADERKDEHPGDSPTASKSQDDSEEVIPSSEDFSSKPKVPAYFAQLDLGQGSDLKIDSAFGSLANKEEDGGGDSSSKKKGGEESQARKLPSMFGLGF